MQLNITPGLIASLPPLVLALEHNPTGAMYLVALAAIVMVTALTMRGMDRSTE
jgi:hypothetical protein